MKRLNIYLVGLCLSLFALPVLQSCDDDGYSLDDFVVRMATVRVTSGNTYYLEIDNGQKLWPGATAIPWYKPVQGQRVWADYTLLSGEYAGYDHAIKVNFLSDVLTKKVEQLTAGNAEMFGNDPVSIEDMWVGGNYLNVQFLIDLPAHTKHRVSLVQNTVIEAPDDGYVHLEYRYNDQDDVTGWVKRSFVSFDLDEFAPASGMEAGYKGIKVKINSIKNGEKELTYDYVPKTSAAVKTIQYSNEVVDGAQ